MTVWAPAAVAVQVAPVQEPFGAIVNVVRGGDVAERVVVLVASLRGVGLRAAGGDRRGGRREREVVERARVDRQRGRAGLAGVVPVTVWAPAAVAVQVAPVQEPLGAIVNVVPGVRSPSELSYWSRPCAV